MRITLHSDYALRVLLYLAAHRDRLVSTLEISKAYGISKHHLVRVVQTLGRGGHVRIVPGRNGGISLAREPAEVNLGTVFRLTEPDMNLVECFDRTRNTCPIAPACHLKSVLHEASNAFVAVFERYTLADVAGGPKGRALVPFFLPARASEPLAKQSR